MINWFTKLTGLLKLIWPPIFQSTSSDQYWPVKTSINCQPGPYSYWPVFCQPWKELFIRFTASAFRKLLSVYVFSYFPFGFEGRMWDLIVSVPDHGLSFSLENIVLPHNRFAVLFSSDRLKNCILVKNITICDQNMFWHVLCQNGPKHLFIEQQFLNLLSFFVFREKKLL